jgi:hypothetical protein
MTRRQSAIVACIAFYILVALALAALLLAAPWIDAL